MENMEPSDSLTIQTMRKLLSIMVEDRVKDLEKSQKDMENVVKKLHRAGYNAHGIKAVLKIYGYNLFYLSRRA